MNRGAFIPSTLALILSLVLVAAVAGFGSRFAPSPWYTDLAKPAWTPPNWLFGPAWTILYILMAVAAWLVWRQSEHPGTRSALISYIVQLILNGLWSWIFLGQQRIGLALLDLLILWIAVLATLILFLRVHRRYGLLLLPYLAWITFAGALNLAIWRLNL
jgi:benzodiazapine receptor